MHYLAAQFVSTRASSNKSSLASVTFQLDWSPPTIMKMKKINPTQPCTIQYKYSYIPFLVLFFFKRFTPLHIMPLLVYSTTYIPTAAIPLSQPQTPNYPEKSKPARYKIPRKLKRILREARGVRGVGAGGEGRGVGYVKPSRISGGKEENFVLQHIQSLKNITNYSQLCHLRCN